MADDYPNYPKTRRENLGEQSPFNMYGEAYDGTKAIKEEHPFHGLTGWYKATAKCSLPPNTPNTPQPTPSGSVSSPPGPVRAQGR
jgi:hypothetical protein